MAVRLAFVLISVAIACAPRAAAAQAEPDASGEPVKDPKLAKKWIAAGHELVQKGDTATRRKQDDDAKIQYGNAITAYEKALETSDDVNLHFDIGAVDEKLGKLDDAVKHYRAIVDVKANARADVVKKAAARIDELSAKIGTVALTITPEGTVVSVNGTELGKSPLAESLVLMPGTYTFAFAAEGYKPKQAELKVEAGSESERTIELEPASTIIVEPPKPPPAAPVVVVAAARPSRLPLYAGGGVTIALAGIATVTGILAIGQHSTYVAAGTSDADRADAHDTGRRLAHVTDACLGGALLAGAFTAYWYVFKYKPALRNSATEHAAPESAKLEVAPWVQPGTSGVAIAGWF